jgi:hypothetical protein
MAPRGSVTSLSPRAWRERHLHFRLSRALFRSFRRLIRSQSGIPGMSGLPLSCASLLEWEGLADTAWPASSGALVVLKWPHNDSREPVPLVRILERNNVNRTHGNTIPTRIVTITRHVAYHQELHRPTTSASEHRLPCVSAGSCATIFLHRVHRRLGNCTWARCNSATGPEATGPEATGPVAIKLTYPSPGCRSRPNIRHHMGS